MTGHDISILTDEISILIRERLGLRGRDLGRQVEQAGRLLPRPVAREARYLAQTAAIARNPRLLKMVDAAHVTQAHRIVSDHLKTVDPRERRRTRIIGIAAVVVFNLLVVVALLLAVLLWRDLV